MSASKKSQKKSWTASGSSGVQERVIENWLINANELSFTIPYAQLLVLKGHRILHISPKKATLEQGKDITSIDGDGVVHCYQLKGGDVTLERWRTEIKPEIDVMVDVPPRHPSLDDDVEWVCHLVVNGEFKGESLREVYDTRQAWMNRGSKAFTVIVRGQLLRDFCDAYGAYLPRALDDFSSFLDVYREDGSEVLNKPIVAGLIEGFFSQILPDDAKKPSNNEIRQTLNAAAISVAYLLNNKYTKKNHVAIIEGWLMLLSYAWAVVERSGLDAKLWKPCQAVVEMALEDAFENLIVELKGREHYAEPAEIPYADAYVYKTRVTSLAGLVAAYALHNASKGIEFHRRRDIKDFLDEVLDKTLVVMKTEGQCVQLALAAVAFDALGDRSRAQKLSGSCLQALLHFGNGDGFHDPYTNIQDVLRSELGLTLHPIAPSMGRNSYVMEGVILVAAHLGQRDALAQWWRKISHTSFHTFRPRDSWQWFYWRSPNGRVEGRFPAQTQSWTALVESARRPDEAIPQQLREQPHYIPLLLCLMPHRFSAASVRNMLVALAAQPGGPHS
ncbi:hypothetical protein ACGFI4_04910 [Micromonospora carbonacea]|uniref:hypothetical protein n=1 Tax=Micromonospora carbonacea TaxID=47853 RepID=UPI0037185CBA